MSLLLLLSCGVFLWQQTVIGSLFFFYSKIHFLFSVQAGRGGVDKKPLTIESLRQVFENSCVNQDCTHDDAYAR